MAESTVENPSDCKNMDKSVTFSCNPEMVDDLIFSFLEEDEDSLKSSCDASIDFNNSIEIIEEEEDENVSNVEEESKAFWESQEELLKATLYRTTSLESKIRQATKDALQELNMVGIDCVCPRMIVGGCKNCLQKQICARLQDAGYNCVVCKSKWRSSSKIQSGEHTYMEVVHNSSSKNGEIKIIIELNFRGEFEMARASEEYNSLINRLPEVYVGKIERLQTLIKMLCFASKKCMKERKMHIAPWRKHKYMEAKWLGTPELKSTPILPIEYYERRQRPRASMLTFDLLDSFPAGWHTKAIQVI